MPKFGKNAAVTSEPASTSTQSTPVAPAAPVENPVKSTSVAPAPVKSTPGPVAMHAGKPVCEHGQQFCRKCGVTPAK